MDLQTLRRPEGAGKRRKRVGRGDGSGHGGTSTRGHKGQHARTGSGDKPGFEGGQMPLQRRLPKRGFKNIHRVQVGEVNLRSLAKFSAGSVIGPDQFREAKLIRRTDVRVKILGAGEIDRALTVRAHAFSQNAKEKIEKAGGRVEILTANTEVEVNEQVAQEG